MIRRVCNHCGRRYDVTEGCPCQKQRRQKQVFGQYVDPFYQSPAWKHVSRDSETDRAAMFASTLRRLSFDLRGLRLSSGVVGLVEYLTLPDGAIRRFPDGLVVHHIIPRKEDSSRELDVENLVTLRHDVHSFVHQLYDTKDKESVQRFLFASLAQDVETALSIL